MKKKLKVCLHQLKLKSKNQANNLVGRIVEELPKTYGEVYLTDFIKALGQGQTWCGGNFGDNKKKSIYWKSQQVFSIDVDNKELDISPTRLIAHFRSLKLCPNVLYYSLSSTPEKLKYRLIWITSDIVNDPNIALGFKRWLIHNSLDAADKACINLDRLYFGGKDVELITSKYIDSNNLPTKKEKKTEKNKRVLDKSNFNHLDFYKAKLRVAECMEDPVNSKYGSRHQTIFKGCIYLTWASGGSKTPDDLYQFISKCMSKYPDVWENYDRDESTIRDWIETAYNWSAKNVFDDG